MEDAKWYALWCNSRCEQLVHDQLTAKGFNAFLPRIETWSRHGGKRTLTRAPMFPGYMFLRHAMDKPSHTQILKCRGLVKILGERWDRLATIPTEEIEAVRRIVDSRLPVLPYPYLREGQRMRLTRGPLANLEGVVVQVNPSKGLLVLSVDLLQRSVAVEVDCTSVAAA